MQYPQRGHHWPIANAEEDRLGVHDHNLCLGLLPASGAARCARARACVCGGGSARGGGGGTAGANRERWPVSWRAGTSAGCRGARTHIWHTTVVAFLVIIPSIVASIIGYWSRIFFLIPRATDDFTCVCEARLSSTLNLRGAAEKEGGERACQKTAARTPPGTRRGGGAGCACGGLTS